MCDSQRGTILHQWLQSGLDQALRMGIKGTGRLVQNKNPRVFENNASDSNALLLTAGELVTALAHDSIVTVIKLHDTIMNSRCFGSRDHLFFCSIFTSVQQVFPDRGIEQVGFLSDDTYELAQ